MQVDWAEMPTRPRIAGPRAAGLRVGLLVAVLGGGDGALHVRHDDRVVPGGPRPRVRVAGRRSARVRLRQPARRRSPGASASTAARSSIGTRGSRSCAATTPFTRTPARPRRRARRARSRARSAITRPGSGRRGASAILAELDDVYAGWRDRVALPRRHATGRHIVAERLAHEREQLRPLPPIGFDAAGRRSSRVPPTAI